MKGLSDAGSIPARSIFVVRRDPLVGGFLMTCADANERSSYSNASATLDP